jgi:hypothetical protein
MLQPTPGTPQRISRLTDRILLQNPTRQDLVAGV